VIKSGRLPGRVRVALSAIMTVLPCNMIWIRSTVVIALMAPVTIRRQATAVLAIGVALTARHTRVCTRQHEGGRIVIERGRLPRRIVMALRARMTELIDAVVRTRRGVVIRLMAAIAIHRQAAAVLSVSMTLTAGHTRVRAG
jgi:hypothetical protein